MSNSRVQHIPCGPYANESERNACDRLRAKIQRLEEEGSWIFLTNIPFSFQTSGLSEEVDLIAIGPSGISVVEIKHWDRQYLKRYPQVVEAEAEKLNSKVKKIAYKLREKFDVGFIAGKVLLTRESGSLKDNNVPLKVRGIPFYSLVDWEDLLSVRATRQLSDNNIAEICKFIEPRSKMTLTGDLRTFGNLVNLELISPREDRFHRIFRGVDSYRREKVILHLYDLSASDDKKSLEKAKREYLALQRFQKSPCLPGLLDSFQDALQYPGELYYYSVMDPLAPSIETISRDNSWTYQQRVLAAARICLALKELHTPSGMDEPGLIHRYLKPTNIKYRVDKGQPIFTELHYARIYSYETISDSSWSFGGDEDFMAPEVKASGLSVADSRSDVYSLCASLSVMFDNDDDNFEGAKKLLKLGLVNDPETRISLNQLYEGFQNLLVKKSSTVEKEQEDLDPEYWHDEYICNFQNNEYKVLGRLGKGGIGQTFKVLQINSEKNTEYGVFVAKTINSAKDATDCLEAYRTVRTWSVHQNLAAIHEVAPEWNQNQICAIMKWIDGIPLSDLIGVLELHAEDLQEASLEELCLRWLFQLCDALSTLHRVNLVHGDVSPKNIIVSGSTVILTDYDSISKVGSIPRIRSPQYCSSNVQKGNPINPSDDIYSLAASLFQVLYEKEPFTHGTGFRKDLGLSWEEVDEKKWPKLTSFLNRATDPSSAQRFKSADDAKRFISAITTTESQTTPSIQTETTKTQNLVPRLLDILKTYPGSLKGNEETRGLDSSFSEETYVETALDDFIFQEIQQGIVSLVILFGNAGDGKTAFLQHLATKLGLPKKHSSDRIWELTLENGLTIRANMDGSASFEGQSAFQLLDRFFEPFQQLEFPEKLIGILAINSGPLLEWLENATAGQTPLTDHLEELLVEETDNLNPRLRFIDLNNRSLVGGFERDSKQISTQFPEKLIEAIVGDPCADPWEPCLTCVAATRCSAWESVSLLRDPEKSTLVKQRFFEALQAVHHKGEIHITAREIRAALSYIFFGVYYCDDLHSNPGVNPGHYFDRAFDLISSGRQGELLEELAQFDPALESHPKMDRYLLDKNRIDSSPPSYPNLPLGSARRKAYFEWRPDWIERVSHDKNFGLSRGRHLPCFRQINVLTEFEKAALCKDLCLGISGLEDLPRKTIVNSICPLRIPPRTATETYFWVAKTAERFSLRPKTPIKTQGLETLHTHLILEYKYVDGSTEELTMGADLFHILLELKDGFQLADAASEDIFANLSIFTQRLAQENSRELFAWNPMEEDSIFKIWIDTSDGIQKIRLDSDQNYGGR